MLLGVTFWATLYVTNHIHEKVVVARVLDLLVGLECREENRPFSGQQHQAHFGLNPVLVPRSTGEMQS